MAFTKVELKETGKDYYVKLVPAQRTVRMSTALSRAVNVNTGDRYDIYRDGNKFLLKPESVGVARIYVHKTAGVFVRNVDLYYTLATADTEKKRQFPVEITDDGLLFTIGEEDGDTRK